MIIVLIVWTGIFFYLLNLDKRMKRFEKEFNNKKNDLVEEAKFDNHQ
jgi:CcmD family protein